jgi:hypothetical protein
VYAETEGSVVRGERRGEERRRHHFPGTTLYKNSRVTVFDNVKITAAITEHTYPSMREREMMR